MEAATPRVRRVDDTYVEVPARTGFNEDPADPTFLRDGVAPGYVKLCVDGMSTGRDILISDLRAGLDLIEEGQK